MQGQRIAHYEIQSRLGGGGMGEVWKAYDRKLQRTVAIKVLTAQADDAAGRILAEARQSGAGHGDPASDAASRGAGDPAPIDGQSFIVMEHVEGKPLSELIPSPELDPDLTEAVVTLAWLAMSVDWDWAGAERYFARALAMDPRLADAHSKYGCFLAWICGRSEEGMAELERAVKLDPMNYFPHYWRADVFQYIGRPEEGIIRLRETVELAPDNWVIRWNLGVTLRLASRVPEAIEEAREAVRESGRHPWALAALGTACAAAGNSEEALALHEELTVRTAILVFRIWCVA